jgi:hypothetical protein
MSHNDIPIDICTLSPPPFLTTSNASEKPVYQDATSLNANPPAAAITATTSGPPPIGLLITGNRKCSDVPYYAPIATNGFSSILCISKSHLIFIYL